MAQVYAIDKQGNPPNAPFRRPKNKGAHEGPLHFQRLGSDYSPIFSLRMSPRLVRPALAVLPLYSSTASCSSWISLAFTDSETIRFLRSTPMKRDSSVSPSFRILVASSTRSRARSEALM